jgi:hypothetical protein
MRRIVVFLEVVVFVEEVVVVIAVVVVIRGCPGKKGRHTGDGNCGDDDDEKLPSVFAPESTMGNTSDSTMGEDNDDDDDDTDGGG